MLAPINNYKELKLTPQEAKAILIAKYPRVYEKVCSLYDSNHHDDWNDRIRHVVGIYHTEDEIKRVIGPVVTAFIGHKTFKPIHGSCTYNRAKYVEIEKREITSPIRRRRIGNAVDSSLSIAP